MMSRRADAQQPVIRSPQMRRANTPPPPQRPPSPRKSYDSQPREEVLLRNSLGSSSSPRGESMTAAATRSRGGILLTASVVKPVLSPSSHGTPRSTLQQQQFTPMQRTGSASPLGNSSNQRPTAPSPFQRQSSAHPRSPRVGYQPSPSPLRSASPSHTRAATPTRAPLNSSYSTSAQDGQHTAGRKFSFARTMSTSADPRDSGSSSKPATAATSSSPRQQQHKENNRSSLPIGQFIAPHRTKTISGMGSFPLTEELIRSGLFNPRDVLAATPQSVWYLSKDAVAVVSTASRTVEALIERSPTMGSFSCGCAANGVIWIGTTDGSIHRLNESTLEEVQGTTSDTATARHTAGITALVHCTPIGAVFSSSVDFTIIKWCAETARTLRVLTGHHGAVKGLALLEGGWGPLVSFSDDSTVRCWDCATGEQFPGQWLIPRVTAIAASSSSDKEVWLGTALGQVLVLNGERPGSDALLVSDKHSSAPAGSSARRTSENSSSGHNQSIGSKDSEMNASLVSSSHRGHDSDCGVTSILACGDTVWVAHQNSVVFVFQSRVSASTGAVLLRELRLADGASVNLLCKAQSATLDVVWLLTPTSIEEWSLHSTVEAGGANGAETRLRELYADHVACGEDRVQLRATVADLQARLEQQQGETERLRTVLREKTSDSDREIMRDLESSRAKALKACEAATSHVQRLQVVALERDELVEKLRDSDAEREELRRENTILRNGIVQAQRQQKLLLDRLDTVAAAEAEAQQKEALARTATDDTETFRRECEDELSRYRSEIMALNSALDEAVTEIERRHAAEVRATKALQLTHVRGSDIARMLSEVDFKLDAAHAQLQRTIHESGARPHHQKGIETAFVTIGAVRSTLTTWAENHAATARDFTHSFLAPEDVVRAPHQLTMETSTTGLDSLSGGGVEMDSAPQYSLEEATAGGGNSSALFSSRLAALRSSLSCSSERASVIVEPLRQPPAAGSIHRREVTVTPLNVGEMKAAADSSTIESGGGDRKRQNGTSTATLRGSSSSSNCSALEGQGLSPAPLPPAAPAPPTTYTEF